MKFIELPLKGAFLVELEPFTDNRGWFTRVFCKTEFANAGIEFNVLQSNLSFSEHKNTLRGLHYQTGPSAEKKFVKCMHGSMLDVIVDVRNDSPTFGQHYKVVLSQDNHLMMMVPEGFAHGFLTLEPNTFVNYLVTSFYNKQSEKGIRWNDPFFAIDWPVNNPILSPGDANCPDFQI